MNRVAFMMAAVLVVAPVAAFADQHVPASDGSEIACSLAARGITRISLVGDGFASSVRRPTGEGQADISVQSEPTRGDIYVSVPDGFGANSVSFFAISRKGYTYKFRCTLTPTDAQQIFVENPAAASGDGKTAEQNWEAPILLMKAMAARVPMGGYEVTNGSAAPVWVGPFEVTTRMVYEGPAMIGKVLRIANRGSAATDITEADLSPPNALLASVTRPHLKPNEATEAFVVLRVRGTPATR